MVEDGVKFLANNTSTYDVIITDSSDPVGPAEALFQKPYFQLLHDALAPGGHISTQGECLWLHLPLIKNVIGATRELFPVAEYAFTTIPTYPSGQIGFAVCSKEKGRDLKTALRKVEGTRYYNADVHRAAFVLPEFGRVMLQEGKDILPVLKRVAAEGSVQKKILLLGSGFVARPAAEYVVRDPKNHLTVGEHYCPFSSDPNLFPELQRAEHSQKPRNWLTVYQGHPLFPWMSTTTLLLKGKSLPMMSLSPLSPIPIMPL